MEKTKEKTLSDRHRGTLWCHFANIFLGFWLLCTQFLYAPVQTSMMMSDIITGGVLIVFGFLSLSRRLIFAPWVIVLAGFWLQFAPLIFYAVDMAAYLNDTMVSVACISFALIIPGIPGFAEEEGHGIPPGWSYNPSAWIQRIPVVALGCVGWLISRYLTAYQLGYIDTVWDPVFGDGTRLVITSDVSSAFPVPDAGLGAFAYTIEAILGCKGGENRWRTMPWIVVGFAMLVVPLGIVSIILVILQPLIVGHFCFLCLLAAGSMLIMVTLTVDEMVAVFAGLNQARREGKSLWHSFWFGDNIRAAKDDKRTPPFEGKVSSLIESLRWGIGFRWNLFITALLGGWLMLTPYAFDLPKSLYSDILYLIGPLVIVTSIIALAEVARIIRYALIMFGLWLAIGSWFLSGSSLSSNINLLIIGVLIVLLCIPRGEIRERYGHWDRWIL